MTDAGLAERGSFGASAVRRQHFVTLDALRGIAALVVVVHHYYWSGLGGTRFFYHGPLAVDFFFILSGMVVAHSYESALQSGRLDFGTFALKRVIRLLPMLWLSVALAALIATGSGSMTPADVVAPLLAGLLSLPDPTSGNATLNLLNPPAWSLFFEMLASLGFALVVPRLSTRALAWSVAALGLAFGAYLTMTGEFNAGSSLVSLGAGCVRVAFGFGLGTVLQRLHARSVARRTHPVTAFALVLAMVATFAMPDVGEWDGLACFVIVAGLYPVTIWLMADFAPSRALATPSKLAGDLSYPIYILHWPLFSLALVILRSLDLSATGLLAWLRLAITGSIIGFSYLALRVYDVPVRQFLASRLTQPRSRTATTSRVRSSRRG